MVRKYLNLKEINLQLFAKEDEEEEEIDGIETTEEEEEETEDETEEEEESEETEEEETEEEESGEEDEDETKKTKDKTSQKKDKVTVAIIREKQENKKLRDKLKAFEDAENERTRIEAEKKHKQKLIDDGYSEEEAEERIADKRERAELRMKLKKLEYGQQADKLSTRYPDIHDHLDSFIEIVEASKGAITLAELCKAKLDETSSHEIKTKAEQEALLNRKKAKDKQIKTGEEKFEAPVKLSPSDERILASMNKKRQMAGKTPLSKKQFYEYSNS